MSVWLNGRKSPKDEFQRKNCSLCSINERRAEGTRSLMRSFSSLTRFHVRARALKERVSTIEPRRKTLLGRLIWSSKSRSDWGWSAIFYSRFGPPSDPLTQNLRKLRAGWHRKKTGKKRGAEGGDDRATAASWTILRSNCSWRREESLVTFIFVRSGAWRSRSDFRLSIVRIDACAILHAAHLRAN